MKKKEVKSKSNLQNCKFDFLYNYLREIEELEKKINSFQTKCQSHSKDPKIQEKYFTGSALVSF